MLQDFPTNYNYFFSKTRNKFTHHPARPARILRSFSCSVKYDSVVHVMDAGRQPMLPVAPTTCIIKHYL